MVEDSWTPSESDIDEALELYDRWLLEAASAKDSLDEAFEAVTASLNRTRVHPTFAWVANNCPDRIYDIDEKFSN